MPLPVCRFKFPCRLTCGFLAKKSLNIHKTRMYRLFLTDKGNWKMWVDHGWSEADPDLQPSDRGGEGGRSSRPWDKGGGLKKTFFRLFGPQFGLEIMKIRGDGPPPPVRESGFRNLRKFWYVNSGVRENFARWIQNPGLWNPEYSSRNLESY